MLNEQTDGVLALCSAEIADLTKANALLHGLVTNRNDEIARLRAALRRIEKWFGEFPETGKCWTNTDAPMSYASAYGSNGERDFMRKVARDALADGQSEDFK